MATVPDDIVRQELLDRRQRLQQAAAARTVGTHVDYLLSEVDAALGRMDRGTFGLCEVCHEAIEADRLIADPLARFCLEHLTPYQQRALETDLVLASSIQKGLLPKPDFRVANWETAYHYQPAGLVSGDYCDLIAAENGEFYFILGDVTGKGVAAAMLMVHLNAMFRTLIPMGLPLADLVERASRVFCESTLPTHYATLVCGKADAGGHIEVCNAGHPPPLLIAGDRVSEIDPTGLPVGAFCDEKFVTSRIEVGRGEAVLLYTDGLSEARDPRGEMYGSDRIKQFARGQGGRVPGALISGCLAELASFRVGAPVGDDLTLMAIRRTP